MVPPSEWFHRRNEALGQFWLSDFESSPFLHAAGAGDACERHEAKRERGEKVTHSEIRRIIARLLCFQPVRFMQNRER
jgi:hypothetical protein